MQVNVFHFDDTEQESKQTEQTSSLQVVEDLLDKISNPQHKKEVQEWYKLAKVQIERGIWKNPNWESLLEIFTDPNDPDLEMLKQNLPALEEYLIKKNIEEVTPVPNSAVVLSLSLEDEKEAA